MKVDTTAIEQEIAAYEKQLRQHYSTKSRLMEEIDSLDPDDRHFIARKSDLDDRLYKMYDKIEEVENGLMDARAKKQAIEADKIIGDNIYKILNICDMPVAIMLSFAKMLGLEKYNDVDPVYFGLNHFGWWTHLYDKSGVDRMPELKEKIMKFGLAASHDKHHSDPSWRHTWENFKEILTDFPEYLPNTYLQYYLYAKESAEDMDPNYTRANMVMDGREKDMIEQAKLIRESGGKKEANLNLFNAFGDFIVDVACSIAYNNADRYLVIVENKGCIPQMPYDAMVEVPCYLRKWGPEPVTIGNIPQFQLGMMMQQVSSEKLIVDAYFEHSYQKALEAFTMNKTVPSAKVARKILDKMIEANKGYWPELH